MLELKLSARDFLTQISDIFQAPPSEPVSLTLLGGSSQELAAITARPELVFIERLDFANTHLSGRDISTLAACSYFKNLEILDLASCYLEGSHILILSTAPFLSNLTELYLGLNKITNGGIQALVLADLPRLQVLDLAFNEINDQGARVLAGAGSLKTLQRLNLMANNLTGEGVVALLSSEKLPYLTSLSCSPFFPNQSITAYPDPFRDWKLPSPEDNAYPAFAYLNLRSCRWVTLGRLGW